MPFDFQYNVNDIETQNDYSHKAVSDGDVTRGEYRVQLPDGRTQIVRYTADWKNGYNAEVSHLEQPKRSTQGFVCQRECNVWCRWTLFQVSYEGEAKYPEGPGQGGANSGGYKY